MPLIVYGIKNCNTVKSALTWLKENEIDFDFHDFKSKGIDPAKLKKWCSQVGWERLVNKRGTTWRQLAPGLQGSVKNESAAISLMAEKTSVIKRPVIASGNTILTLGFDAGLFEEKFRIFPGQ